MPQLKTQVGIWQQRIGAKYDLHTIGARCLRHGREIHFRQDEQDGQD